MPFKNLDHISLRNFFNSDSSISWGITIFSLILLLLAKLAFRFFKVDRHCYCGAVAADRTVLHPFRQLYLAPLIRQSVEGQQIPCEQLTMSREIFYRFKCLHRAYYPCHSTDDSRLAARWHSALWGRGFKNTAIAGGDIGYISHQLTRETQYSSVGERLLRQHAGIVYKELRGEIISAVDDEIVVLYQTENVSAVHLDLVGLDHNIGVEVFYGLLGGSDFRFAQIGCCYVIYIHTLEKFTSVLLS